MGQRTVVYPYDDITGQDDDTVEAVPFAWEGQDYTIDLGEKNRAALAKALAPYLAKATKVGRVRQSQKPSGSGRQVTSPADRKAVREWAETVGIDIPQYGQIKGEVWEQWHAAGSPRGAGAAA